MVLADHAYIDKATNKAVIAGTFSRVHITQMKAIPQGGGVVRLTGPLTQAGSPWLYLALFGVRGHVPLSLKFVDLEDAKVLFDATVEVSSHDPVTVAEFILQLPSLPILKPGAYSLDLLHDGEILGQWRIAGMPAGEPSTENQGAR
jgi:hypothetical protein